MRDEVLAQLERDAEFLRRNNIMDYSLLVGIHRTDAPTHPSRRLNPHLLPASSEGDVFDGSTEQQDAGAALATAAAQVLSPADRSPHLPALVPEPAGAAAAAAAPGAAAAAEAEAAPPLAVAAHVETPGTGIEKAHGTATEIYFCGIIDILQPYTLRKQLEHGFKSLRYESVCEFVLVAKMIFRRLTLGKILPGRNLGRRPRSVCSPVFELYEVHRRLVELVAIGIWCWLVIIIKGPKKFAVHHRGFTISRAKGVTNGS
jgi:1-phosphatidylinositol-4-phosphate 5-kinase